MFQKLPVLLDDFLKFRLCRSSCCFVSLESAACSSFVNSQKFARSIRVTPYLLSLSLQIRSNMSFAQCPCRSLPVPKPCLGPPPPEENQQHFHGKHPPFQPPQVKYKIGPSGLPIKPPPACYGGRPPLPADPKMKAPPPWLVPAGPPPKAALSPIVPPTNAMPTWPPGPALRGPAPRGEAPSADVD